MSQSEMNDEIDRLIEQRDDARAEAERWRAERNAIGLYAHELEHRPKALSDLLKRTAFSARQLLLVVGRAVRTKKPLAAGTKEQVSSLQVLVDEITVALAVLEPGENPSQPPVQP